MRSRARIAKEADFPTLAARKFESQLELDVVAWLPTGERRWLAETPGEVAIPEHRLWWVRPRSTARKVFDRLLEELRAADVPGLCLAQLPVTDAHAAKLVPLAEQLRFLDLSGCQRFRQKGLVSVGELRRLTCLNLEKCRRLPGSAVAHLAGLTELRHLNLSDIGADSERLSDQDMSHLSGFELLLSLDLRCGSDISRGLARLSPLQQLTRLRLPFQEGDVDPLPFLAELSGLVSLENVVGERDFRALASLPHLRELECLFVDHQDAESLGELAQLRRLSVGSLWWEAANILASQVPLLKNLEARVNGGGGPTPRDEAQFYEGLGLAALPGLGQLEALDIESSLHTSTIAKVLDGLVAGAHLRLFVSEEVDDAALTQLAPLPLSSLDIRGPSVSDKGLRALRSQEELRELSLWGPSRISLRGVQSVARLPHLHTLVVGDAAELSDDELTGLCNPQLRVLRLPPQRPAHGGDAFP